MVSLNKVFVAGNLTRDPEVRQTSSGQSVGGFDVAINSSFLTKTGERKDETVFVHVVVWGRQAETVKTYLTKGAPVLVEGRLQMDSWETREGEKRSRLNINANRVQFLGRPRERSGESPYDSPPISQTQPQGNPEAGSGASQTDPAEDHSAVDYSTGTQPGSSPSPSVSEEDEIPF